MSALVVDVVVPDGAVTEAPYPKSLEEWQGLVGGYIEQVYCPDEGGILIVNENGRLLGLPNNPTASWIAGQSICGTAIHLYGAALSAWKRDV